MGGAWSGRRRTRRPGAWRTPGAWHNCRQSTLSERFVDIAARRRVSRNEGSRCCAYLCGTTKQHRTELERLQRDTLGQHTVLLTGLRIEANRSANTVISDANANRTISTIVRRLSEDGQIGAAPQPRVIVDGLVGAHLLVRSVGANGAVSFQHQLFQEWYAAAEVEDFMVKAAAGDADARKRLREELLDRPSWEEFDPLRVRPAFACGRGRREGGGGRRRRDAWH